MRRDLRRAEAALGAGGWARRPVRAGTGEPSTPERPPSVLSGGRMLRYIDAPAAGMNTMAYRSLEQAGHGRPIHPQPGVAGTKRRLAEKSSSFCRRLHG